MRSDRILKYVILLFVAGHFMSSNIYAQISQGGLPYSYLVATKKSAAKIPTYITKRLDIENLQNEDEKAGSPCRYSIFENVAIDIKDAGLMEDLPLEGGKLWRYRVESENARSLQLYFSYFRLPEGATLYMYNRDYSDIYGAFTSENNNSDNDLMIADFFGNEVIVEYFEPSLSQFEGEVFIGSIGLGYKDITEMLSSEDYLGYININCIEGKEWQEEKHAVFRYSFRDDNVGYLCTGTLINNARNDGTPYFLTANHCVGDNTSASTVVAWFNYEKYGCSGDPRTQQTLSKASLKTGNSSSDFSLCEFSKAPTATYQPFYAGWDATGDPGLYSVCIHHPEGSIKKISFDDSAAISHEYEIYWEGSATSPIGSHWRASFDRGKTNTGSSGAALINNDKQIIGQLHGGNDYYDFFGKIDYSMEHSNLNTFLDPDNSGIMELDGYYPTDVMPDPQFYPDFKNVCTAAPVKLYGFSAFNPESWSWSFSPDSVTYYEGTNSESQEPVVSFDYDEQYDITVTSTNSGGTESYTFSNYVRVGSELDIEVAPYSKIDSCLSNFDSLVLMASGAAEFNWVLDTALTDYFYMVDDQANPLIIKASEIPAKETDLLVTLTGIHGSCSQEISYTMPLFKPNNDSAINAIEVFLGDSEEFTNKCTGIEENEPEPPHTSCTGQNSWCDEYGTGEDIVEHSVWFYFIPDSTGVFELRSYGMDNQAAVYEAENAEDLFTGNYKLVGANDDFSSANFNPVLKNLELTAGKKYYIQVDGSAGGVEGHFTLNIKDVTGVGTNPRYVTKQIKVYPQPVSDILTLEHDGFQTAGKVNIKLYNLTGSQILNKDLYPSGNTIQLETSTLENGIYLLLVSIDRELYTVKVVK